MKHTTLSLPHRAAIRLMARMREGMVEASRRPDRGDISTTTVIIWVAAVTGAVVIAGSIALVVAKYNAQISGL
ncbi:hypothetical protein ACIOJ9_38850 [Streptomyces sp. NPDC088175]|uniref:hypothetical protein n=1 Tax=unclassified Streptomyces TaxID=2593676 RepID=UPI00382F9CA3